MTAIANAVNTPSIFYNSLAISDASMRIKASIDEIRERFRSTFSIGWGQNDPFEKLHTIRSEAKFDDWDGYNSKPINEDAAETAWKFLDALPFTVDPPDVSPNPNGNITFEWYRSPRKLLSIDINSEGILYFAAVIGNDEIWGKTQFRVDFPAQIMDLIGRIIARY